MRRSLSLCVLAGAIVTACPAWAQVEPSSPKPPAVEDPAPAADSVDDQPPVDAGEIIVEEGPIIEGRVIVEIVPKVPAGGKRNWGPEQATGAPDTPDAGDRSTAWASATSDGGDEWLELDYDKPIVPEAIVVYENSCPGALFRITTYTDTGMEAELWSGVDPTDRSAANGVSEIPVKVKLEVQRIRLHLHCKDVPGWNEIDAVGIRDADGAVHWAVRAGASSTYASGPPPETAIDPRDDEADRLRAEVARLKKENADLRRELEEARKAVTP